MFAKIKSLGLFGLDAFIVDVEASIDRGIPAFDIVGLPDAAVRESRNRVRSTIKNVGLDFPISKITINLAPADIKKEGAIYDLPILIAIMAASGQLNVNLDSCAFLGELSLNGEVKPIKGTLAMLSKAKELGINTAFIPKENEAEGAVIDCIKTYASDKLYNLMYILSGL